MKTDTGSRWAEVNPCVLGKDFGLKPNVFSFNQTIMYEKNP